MKMFPKRRTGYPAIVTFVLCLSVFLSASLLPEQVSASDSDVEGFVTRFYEQCLGRQPDAAGLSYWVESLNLGQTTGADLAWSFIFSEEFQDSETTDEEFLDVLYQAFFNRVPDTEGYNHWIKLMVQGMDRASVLDGFTCAQEFSDLCDSYGISSNSSESSSDDDKNVEGFVTRFYQQCLDRDPDADGMNYWVQSLNAGELSGSDLAWSFIFSEEFQNSTTTDEEYLKILYRAFFNRAADDGGFNYWLSLMARGTDRCSVLEGFTTAQEFVDLCEAYGIKPGNASSNQGRSDSFFPVTADGVDTITWRYRINGGAPVSASYQGVNLNMTFSDMDLSVNNGDMIRQGSLSGSVSGDATGSFSAIVAENIFSSGDSALFSGQTIDMEMFISAYGESVNVQIYADTQLDTPLEWFLSRSDLDQLPAGEYYDQTGEVTGTATGYIEISSAGYSDTTPFSETVMSVDTWEIIEKLDNYTVNGVTYNNVVVVNRYTSLPLSPYSSDGPVSVTIKYWLAKGIGMIKGIGQYEILGEPLEIELVSTNLSQ
ncbi:DUF4214 domain-containing protein [Desulfobacter curvatus]|uniref:DUF4214 domain-containing protein n=1 Tax=Desulfobacter curvatus TaxID=2290 RepID=UPI0003646866|nr:DUF4214 domain-containing protein [Desulfobacter curvatus]